MSKHGFKGFNQAWLRHHTSKVPQSKIKSAGSQLQKSPAKRKGRAKVHPKGHSAKNPGIGDGTERLLFANFILPDNRRRDGDGLLCGLVDSLVHTKLLPDDSLSKVHREFVGATIVPGESGVEIIIVEFIP